jgi:hypothetical protein
MFGVVALGLTACGGPDSAAPGAEDPAAVKSVAPSVVASALKPSPFDARGNLKASGLKIDWFEIPAGFESAGSRPQHHLFVSHEVSMEQLREFLASRMLTGQVAEQGKGAIYRGVMPVSAASKAIRFDVQVALIDQGTGVSLALDERTFLGAPPLSPAEAAKVLAAEQARAE